MLVKDLSEDTLWQLSIIERTAASLSLIGICFIITSFLFCKAFHKSINRLIFFASVGNFFTCVGTLISRDAISGTSVSDPVLCKTQSFLIQMFMPADALWAFILAINVYLTFYWRYRAKHLKSLEKWYCVFCYGITFLLAFILLWVETEEKGPMYGNATLWCWIAPNWDHYRMYLFYGPIWIICIATIAIYARLLVTLLSNYSILNGFSRRPAQRPTVPSNNAPITGIRTTDISFQTEPAVVQPAMPLNEMPDRNLNRYPRPSAPARTYNCQITGGSIAVPPYPGDQKDGASIAASEIPSRLNSTAGTTDGGISPSANPTLQDPPRNSGRADTALQIMGTVALFFFFIMLITWIPSSANRLYSVVHPKQVSVALEYAASCVLPLQGFWNSIIYILMSRHCCSQTWESIKDRRNWKWTAQDISDVLKDAFIDHYIFDHPRDEACMDYHSPESTVIGPTSRPYSPHVFHSEDDSITLLESLESSRISSSRPATGRPDMNRV
ncbi:hypothetical protein ONS95_002578 [Cadophora gregata]|uniref:uncharacterized protein n=1 Tax=Cadophora gregata TaxID=51156 RepID=UPI0026DD3540|nr:uncharacterized protein ONS95_002578 [Cadophora gregata]KAK0109907.1 hypothetical protein ONS95_002578 [Cadophora gregata]KAK0110464.1 hypothetical protein ONS96_002075 [Cadophora gregata f. sp. sojae]